MWSIGVIAGLSDEAVNDAWMDEEDEAVLRRLRLYVS